MRGFFCSDLSLRYPYRECTITVPMLLVCMLLLPMLFIAVVEIVRICKRFRMRQYLRNVSRNLATFSFGFIATYLTTELAKNVVGRLRPHFYAACQPRLPSGSSCEDSIVTGTNELNGVTAASGYYVEHYYCANSQLSAEQQRELYVSFPSAHSSLSFYSMLFLAFYLHHVWHAGRGSCRVLRHILQFLLMLMAWFISLSRVADYWHHWSDVFAGALMGVAYATLNAIYVGGMLRPAQPLEDYVLTASALDTTHKHKVGNGGSNKLMQPMLVVAPQAGVACPCSAATPYNGGDSCATSAAHRKVSI